MPEFIGKNCLFVVPASNSKAYISAVKHGALHSWTTGKIVMKIRFPFLKIVAGWILISLPAAAVYAQTNETVSPSDPVLQKCIARLQQFPGFAYDASFKMKFFDNADTTDFYSRHCRVLKKQEDTILKYHAIVSNGSTDVGYTGDQFFMSDKKEKWLKREPVVVLGRSFIRNNIGLNFVPSFIYSTDPFSSWIKAAVDITRVADSRSEGKNCYVIKFLFKADEEITKSERYLYIDKQTFLPVSMQGYAEYKGIQQEYQELVIKNLVGLKNKKAAINYRFLPGLEPEPFDMARKKTEVPFLTPGTEMPQWDGKYINSKPFRPADLSDKKLVVLDFWYLACPPCLKAIPELANLQTEYGAKGLQILGLNSTDTSEKKIAEINKFIPVLQMNYPVVMVSKETEQAFRVSVWPTFYLVENGKIIYAGKGYDENEFKKLRTMIEQRLSGSK